MDWAGLGSVSDHISNLHSVVAGGLLGSGRAEEPDGGPIPEAPEAEGTTWAAWFASWLLPTSLFLPLGQLLLGRAPAPSPDGVAPAPRGVATPKAAEPSVLVYDVGRRPPKPRGCHLASEEPRPAHGIPLNGPAGAPFANEHFEGEALFLHRPLRDSGETPYGEYFRGKTRSWELRVQGRFRKLPLGTLWAGCVMEDFDYRGPPTMAALVLARIGLPVLKLSLGQDIYFTWGERGEAAEADSEPELSHMVARLPGWDQIIATPAGEPPPSLAGDLSSLGVRRNALSSCAFSEAVARVEAELTTEETYTFCFWGLSRFYNLRTGLVTGLIPGGWTVDSNSFMEGYPVHLAMYDLAAPDPLGKHLESQKRYIFDFLVIVSAEVHESLSRRYDMEVETTHEEEEERAEEGTNGRQLEGVEGATKEISGPRRCPYDGACLAPLLRRPPPGCLAQLRRRTTASADRGP